MTIKPSKWRKRESVYCKRVQMGRFFANFSLPLRPLRLKNRLKTRTEPQGRKGSARNAKGVQGTQRTTSCRLRVYGIGVFRPIEFPNNIPYNDRHTCLLFRSGSHHAAHIQTWDWLTGYCLFGFFLRFFAANVPRRRTRRTI